MDLESFETKHIKNSAAEKSNIYGVILPFWTLDYSANTYVGVYTP